MKQVVVIALVVSASMSFGCSLARNALGSPPIGGDDTGVEAGTTDGGMDIDAFVDVDAYVEDTGLDAGMDAFVPSDAGPDADIDAYSIADTGCVPTTTACMTGATEVWVCGADGEMRWRQTCTLGCSDTGGAHCIAMRATHVVDDTLLPSGTTALHVANGQTVQIDAGTGAITLMPSTVLRAPGASSSAGAVGFSSQAQTGGPALGIFTFSTITVDQGGTLLGVGGQALVLLATGDVVIDGVIDVGANGTVGGPAGFSGGGHRANGGGTTHGNAGDVEGLLNDLMSGGGGGGHAGTGGRGGAEDPFCCATADGGSGGGVTADADGVILTGGSGGGGGADGSTGGVGGGGGGALQITSSTMIHITFNGLVRSPGAGGGHGDEAGGGGGAGGTLFFEAMTITLDGALSVNGGSGAGGHASGADGTRGTDASAVVPGGAGHDGGGGGGNGGGGATTNATDGGEGDGGGGGGGGGGRISFVTMSGMHAGTMGTFTPTTAVREAVLTIR